MNEHEYIVKEFKNNFGAVNKKIILYGIGINTRTILEEFPKIQFLGVMDGFKNDGVIYGKSILSMNEAVLLKPDCIIIIARENSTKIICNRIAPFCRKNEIDLYNVHGENLLNETQTQVLLHQYFSVTKETLVKEIVAHEIISFDIFDTLLMRTVLYPEDVFALMEKKSQIIGFCAWRIQTERELNREAGVPTLEQIYRVLVLKSLITMECAATLLKLELQIEKSVLIARNDVVAMMRFAIANGKRVFLISDMYLSKKVISDILLTLGITGYEGIFVSAEYQTAKSQDLYEKFKQCVNGASYLHIGDNADIDVTYANMHGIDGFRVYSARDMAEISVFKEILGKANSLDERILVGIFLAEVFNSPFTLAHSDGRPVISNGYDLGFLFLGPILTAFMVWLIHEIHNTYDWILFSARDGYIFHKMYQLIKKQYADKCLPKDHYFYISRLAAISAHLVNEEDIRYAANIGFSGIPEDMLKKRFFLSDTEILPLKEKEVLCDYIMRHKTIILQRSVEIRQRYRRYIESLKFGLGDHLAFFDFVSSGTCQMCLSDILENKITGFDFIRFIEDYDKKKALDVKAFVETGFLYDLQSYLSGNYLLIESIIVSMKPTLKGFDKTGNPFYVEEKRSLDELEYIQNAQSGILDYFSRYLAINGIFSNEINPMFVDAMYSLIQKKYSVIENCIFTQNLSRDEFCNREYMMDTIFL